MDAKDKSPLLDALGIVNYHNVSLVIRVVALLAVFVIIAYMIYLVHDKGGRDLSVGEEFLVYNIVALFLLGTSRLF